MQLDQQLKRWKDAELISAAQAERIVAFEKQRQRPALLYAVAGLAGLAVAIGLISIVASNWDLVPGRVKLVLDLLVVTLLGQAVVYLKARPPAWLEEAATIALYGLVLASIALVGQVYQLGGNAALALLAWSVLTFPLMLLASSPRASFLWVLGLEVTYFVGLSELAKGGPMRSDFALAAVYWAPLCVLALGRSGWLGRVRPEQAGLFRALGWSQLVLMASAASFAFYDALVRGERAPWLAVGISLFGTIALSTMMPSTPAGRAQRLLLAVAFTASHLPMFMPHGQWPLGAALAFIVVFAAVALVAHKRGRPRLLHLATAAVGLRLLAIYFEVFGSLLDTGLGLVLGGLLTLFVTWFWARKRRDFDRELLARDLSTRELSARESTP
jgi:uncharacterized membrane protein